MRTCVDAAHRPRRMSTHQPHPFVVPPRAFAESQPTRAMNVSLHEGGANRPLSPGFSELALPDPDLSLKSSDLKSYEAGSRTWRPRSKAGFSSFSSQGVWTDGLIGFLPGTR